MMKLRLHDLIILFVTAAPLCGGMAWLVFRRPRVLPPAANLTQIRELARNRQFEPAQSQLEAYLLAHRADNSAHLLMAQVATDRPVPQPVLALDHLRKIQPGSSNQAALVQFFMGKAQYQQGRYDLAEDCWREALRLDLKVPEAGWALFDLLGVEGRTVAAHQLGLRLHEIETDPRDRVQFLIEMIRLDIDKTAAGSIVILFQPLAEKVPDQLVIASTLGLALIHDSRVKEGLAILRASLKRHPDSPEAWDASLTGLEDSGEIGEHASEFARLPKPFASSPRFVRHEGLVAQGARDWQAASRAYGRALTEAPYDGVLLSRLHQMLRLAGNIAESDRIGKRLQDHQTAYKAIRAVVTEISSLRKLGYEPHPDIYQRLAQLREQMGRFDDALAWHRLVLRDRPNDTTSIAAIARLTSPRPNRPE